MFYAVSNGREPGVYTSWDECRKQVLNFGGACFKKFKTLKDAECFVGEHKKITTRHVYAVKYGRKPGVYETWSGCQQQILNFKGAVFKKFKTMKEAKSFVKVTPVKVVLW